VGLLTPLDIWHALGVTAPAKQLLAMIAGGVFGVVMLLGIVVLMHRRYTEPRIRATTRGMDWIVLWLLLVQLALGLYSITVSAQHLDGGEMVRLMTWAQHVVTFRGDSPALIANAPLVFKLHLVLGMTLFLIFPFSRLVHIWSGFAALGYLTRAYQLVRSR
jgi:nitrate reductase gamma subunit